MRMAWQCIKTMANVALLCDSQIDAKKGVYLRRRVVLLSLTTIKLDHII
jgi:hypothetical protein